MTDFLPAPIHDDLPALYADDKAMAKVIANIRKAVDEYEPDLTTAKGRKECKSLAHAVTRSKTALDNAGAEIVADMRAKVKAVDAKRKAVRDELDEIRDAARAPVTAWEDAEEKRIAALTARIAEIETFPDEARRLDDDGISALIVRLKGIVIDETFEEREDEARSIAARVEQTLSDLHDAAIAKRKADEEAAAMRVELEERRKADEAREAARAEQEAENARLRAEMERMEQEKAKAEVAAEAAKEAVQRAAEEAQRREEAAAEAERRRIEQEAAQERYNAEREANAAKLMEEAKSDAYEALDPLCRGMAGKVLAAIIAGEIPHVHFGVNVEKEAA